MRQKGQKIFVHCYCSFFVGVLIYFSCIEMIALSFEFEYMNIYVLSVYSIEKETRNVFFCVMCADRKRFDSSFFHS